MTMLLRLAWRNLGRNKRRTALTIAAGVFATLLSMVNLSVAEGSHERWIDHSVRLYPGHFQVSVEGYREYRTLDYGLALEARAEQVLDALPNGARWAPRLESFGLISADTEDATGRGVQLFGIDAAREAGLSKLVDAIDHGRMAAPVGGAREIALGARLAKNLGVSLGQSVVVLSTDAFGSQSAERFAVVGTFSVGEDELDGFGALVDLSVLQEFLVAGRTVSHVAVFVSDSEDMAPVGAALAEGFPEPDYETLPWPALMPDLVQFLKLDDVSNWVSNAVLIVVVGFGLLNTILMSVFERVRELGVLRALGLRPRAVFALVLIESVQLSLLGIAVGFAIGIPLVLFLAQHPIPMTGESVRATTELFDVEPVIVFALGRPQLVTLPVLLVAVGILAAIPPAIRASRGRPVDALRAT
jgi:ABC-type lipoprotein release transport system permease subunit